MSGKHCGPSKAALDLDKKIGGAMDSVQNSIIGDAAGGIADGISGLKSSLTGLTDGIVAEIEKAIPEIPKPKANLQEQMTKLMSNLDNPTALLSELDSIKKNFGDTINVDDMLSKAGLDASKLEGLSVEFGAIAKLGAGDLSAVKGLMGGLPSITLPGSDPASIISGICKDVPNIDLDAEGNTVKKGTETKVASSDAEPIEEAEEANATEPQGKDPAASDYLDSSDTIILNPDTEEAQKIEQEFTDDIQAIKPLLIIVLDRQAEFYENRQKARDLIGVFRTSDKNKEKIRELKKRNIIIVRRNNKDTLYNELRMKNFEYVRDDKLHKAQLILQKPQKPNITWEEIHERTLFQRYTTTINLILEIPNLEIKGERPKPYPFKTPLTSE